MRTNEDIIDQLLIKRGIADDREREEFLSPRPVKTYDPFLFSDMKAGVDLILDTAAHGGRICVYGDYDADGMTSVSIMLTVLRELTDKADYYIPSRFTEGFGLNRNAIRKIRDRGTDLMITVDCGSVFPEEIEYAKELGMEVIVTDHHNIDEVRADCLLINPRDENCGYPFAGLAGCGVAYKLAQAIQQQAGLPKKIIADVLDIAGLGTVGDIVPLIDENRTIAKYGIYKLNSSPRPGIRKLAEKLSLHIGAIGSEQIAYAIVPSLNAAGRMATADDGVALLMTEDEVQAEKYAEKLMHYNSERKKMQELSYEKCLGLIDEQCRGSLFPVIEADDAHEGITGIVAGKLKTTMGLPVAVVTPAGGGMLKGTARSIDTVDLYELVSRHQDMLERFGGHSRACGFMINKTDLQPFREALDKDVRDMLAKDSSLLDRRLNYDLELVPGEATLALAKALEQLAPFGNCNEKPLFLLKSVSAQQQHLMGRDDRHVRFRAAAADGSGVECVMFGVSSEDKTRLFSGRPLDITAVLNINIWNGREKLQAIVEDML